MSPEEREKEYRRMQSVFKKDSRIKECFHHNKEECEGKIKQSHSIQRNGRLSIIEGEVNGNQSIYTFTSFKSSPERMLQSLVPIGKKEASTFFGFCDYHDTNLFSPIENFEFDDSDEHLFLHSYRSFAHSYHRKQEEVNIYSNPESDFIKTLPPQFVDTFIEGLQMGVNDVKPHKESLDKALDNKEYDYLEYLVYEKDGLYPFAVSSGMSPRVSYSGKPMNNHVDETLPWSMPLITFLPDKAKTFVIIAAFPDDKNAVNLLDELYELNDYQLERAITSLIIANCENTFFSPKVWRKMSDKQKRELLNEFEINTNGMQYRDKFFHSRFNFFSDFFEISNL
ncbi:hypothetical protein GCM10009118_04020 [Wandonia haliotis]|uniref:Uncharacterized protein n=1 Tax=Wandonia haliotis TaxID=574963 RepID=A0ABN1ML61_9FLAO